MSETLTLPRFTGWMLPDDALALLVGLMRERWATARIGEKEDLIVEAGSGRSTVVLAAALEEIGQGRLVALEQRPESWEETTALLSDNGLQDRCEVRLAPLEEHGIEGCLTPVWYARSAWDDLAGIGMLLVDGPPGHLTRFARDPALPLLHERLLPGAIAVLDDVNRPEEQEILRHWQRLGFDPVRVPHSTGELAWGRR